MKTFSIKEAIRHSYGLFTHHKKVLVLSALILMFVPGFNANKGQGWGHEGFGSPLVWLVLFAVGVVIKIGWFKILLKVESGQSPRLKELFTHLEIFWKYLGVYIIYVLMLLIGTILFIIPGLYFLITYGFAPLIIVDKENLSIKQAFKESARLSKGIKWKLFGFFLVMVLLNIVGAICLFVGLLVSLPVTTLAFVHIYRKLESTHSASV